MVRSLGATTLAPETEEFISFDPDQMPATFAGRRLVVTKQNRPHQAALLAGEPIAGALMNVWQSDEEGFYDVQRSSSSGGHEHRARARLQAGEQGRFHFRSILPQAYPIPDDGPVGRLLEALGRHPWRPPHLHFMIEAPGYERLITHVFRGDGPYLDSDAVFGVRSTLIADWERHQGSGPDEPPVYYTLEHDFVLNPVPTYAVSSPRLSRR